MAGQCPLVVRILNKMSYNIATFLIPALLGLLLAILKKRKKRISYSSVFLFYSFILSYYYLLLYFLSMEDIWDTSWAFYSVGFLTTISLLIGLVLLAVEKINPPR